MNHDPEVLRFASDEIKMWLEPETAIHIKALTKAGDPVELNADQARLVAQELLRLAEQLDD